MMNIILYILFVFLFEKNKICLFYLSQISRLLYLIIFTQIKAYTYFIVHVAPEFAIIYIEHKILLDFIYLHDTL